MNKIMKAGAAVAAVAAVATGALVISALGSNDREVYTMNQPADKVTFNSITDNPMIMDGYTMHGDERWFVEASPYTGNAADLSWSDETYVENGKEYVVHMYVHNDAASNLNLVAEDVTAHVGLPTEAASSITIMGDIYSSNARPNTVSDGTTFVSADGKDFKLEYVSGSAMFTNCDESSRNEADKACTASRSFNLSDDIISDSGVLLGYNEMDGKIPGCIAYAGWVSFHVKAQFNEEPDYTIEKLAKIKDSGADWSHEVRDAKDGDTIVYSLHFTNTGNTNLYSVNIRDNLPSDLEYVKGSTVIRTPNHADGVVDTSDAIITEAGVYIGDFAPGSDAYVIFESYVKEGVDDECMDTEITNKVEANASTTPDGKTRFESKEDIATVFVDGRVCTESYELDKMVRLENDTEWSETVKAKAGEKVYYRIRFFNTGELDLNNVVLSDKMPEHMTNISEVKYGPVSAGDAELKIGEGFFGDGLNIGTVKAGETYAVYFHATVDESLAGACESAELKNVVTGKYNNDDSSIKTDDAIVYVDAQVCTEENPNFIIDKMVQIKGSDKWSENVTVKANETVRYRIQFKNTGNTKLENVVISDTLPAGINYVAGSTVLHDAANADGKTVGDELVNGGLNIGSVEAGSEATIYFYATVDNSFADDCNSSKHTNIARGKYNNDNNTSKEDSADVTVTGIVCDVPEYPQTGAEGKLGNIIAAAMLVSSAAGYIISRKK